LSKKRKNKQPHTAFDLELHKTPRIDPGNSPDRTSNKHPSWRFGIIDLDGMWGYRTIASQTLVLDIRDKLSSFEGMTWTAIESAGSHFISKSDICPDANRRLSHLRLDDVDELFSLRLTGKKRIWGIRDNEVLKILWWDPDHTICPSPKKHT